MNEHKEIQKLLSAYVGGDLDPDRSRGVESHLTECPDCRAGVDDLRALMGLLRSVPEVEPPPWMTTRVIAILKEQQAEKRSWLQRIFFPLHIKLPIEVMALLVVCVSGYYLSRNVESELKQQVAQQGSDIPATRPQPMLEAPESGKRVEPAASVPRPADQLPIVPKAAVQPDSMPSKSVPTASPAAVPAPPAYRHESSAPATGAGIDSIKSEETFVRPLEDAREKKRSSKSMAKDEAESLSSAPAASSALAPAAAVAPQLKIRLMVHIPETASQELQQAIIGSGGTLHPAGGKQYPVRQIAARIPNQRLTELLGRLERLGRIVERPAATGSSGTIELVVLW